MKIYFCIDVRNEFYISFLPQRDDCAGIRYLAKVECPLIMNYINQYELDIIITIIIIFKFIKLNKYTRMIYLQVYALF